jgi:hypothetical protein
MPDQVARDDDLPPDVSVDVEPLDLAWAKVRLDARGNALESPAPAPGRHVGDRTNRASGPRIWVATYACSPLRLARSLVRTRSAGTLALEDAVPSLSRPPQS